MNEQEREKEVKRRIETSKKYLKDIDKMIYKSLEIEGYELSEDEFKEIMKDQTKDKRIHEEIYRIYNQIMKMLNLNIY